MSSHHRRRFRSLIISPKWKVKKKIMWTWMLVNLEEIDTNLRNSLTYVKLVLISMHICISFSFHNFFLQIHIRICLPAFRVRFPKVRCNFSPTRQFHCKSRLFFSLVNINFLWLKKDEPHFGEWGHVTVDVALTCPITKFEKGRTC